MKIFKWLDQLADDFTANFWNKWLILILIAWFSLLIEFGVLFLVFYLFVVFDVVSFTVILPTILLLLIFEYFFFKICEHVMHHLVAHF
jgi:ABC-type protease/lipase transport system fused ATPase/permease subunit